VPLLIYLFASIIFLWGILFSPGVILGADYAMPFTDIQIENYFQSGQFSWTNVNSLTGFWKYFSVSTWFELLLKLWILLGISGVYFLKFWLIFLFIFAGSSMYLLLRYLGCRKLPAIIGGFSFITTPIFFNYAAIGWSYVLFSLAVLPIAVMFFLRSVEENKLEYAIIAGLLYAFAVIQSQSFVWYMLCFLFMSIYLVNSKNALYIYFKMIAIVVLVCLLLHFSWILPLLLNFEHSHLGNQNIVKNEMSIGTWYRLSYSNMLRLWGGLYNYQYETLYPYYLAVFSFVVPFVFSLSLILLNRKKLIIPFFILYMVPVVLYTLGPDLISRIPLSSIIRDVARFTTLSAFAYSVILGLTLHYLFSRKSNWFKYIVYFVLSSIFVNSYFFWNGGISGDGLKKHDVKLRTYEYPQEYYKMEEFLQNNKNGKTLFLPLVDVLHSKNNVKYNGEYSGFRDPFSLYSSSPGGLSFLTSGLGSPSSISYELKESISNNNKEKFSKLLSLLNIHYVVLRADVVNKSLKQNIHFLGSVDDLSPVDGFLDDAIFIFENKYYYPHIYTSNDLKFLISENSGQTNDYLSNFKSEVDFFKVNPTKYKIKIKHNGGGNVLIFSESFHKGWRLYIDDREGVDNLLLTEQGFNGLFETNDLISIKDDNHFVVNGYANAWYIESDIVDSDNNGEIDMIMEFYPQKLFYYGLIVSILTLILSVLYLFYKGISKNTPYPPSN